MVSTEPECVRGYINQDPGPGTRGPEDPGPKDPGPEDPGPEDPGPSSNFTGCVVNWIFYRGGTEILKFVINHLQVE